jgi:uncharacterized protein (TIGR02466 family)
MFEECKVNQMFPTCVWVHEVKDHQALNDRLADTLLRLRDSGTATAADKTSWQSRGNLHTLEEFRPLIEIFTAATKGVLDFLKYQYAEIEITNCWANINRSGQSHTVHTHPNNFLSGVYYLRAPQGAGDIVFQDPRQQATVMVPKVSQYTEFNATTHSIAPKEGALLMFNSWFQHSVEENRSEEERMSIAFNVMLRGEFGRESGRARF